MNNPLHWACYYGDLNLAKLLNESRIDNNVFALCKLAKKFNNKFIRNDR